MNKIIKTPFSNLKNKTGKHKNWYSLQYIKILCSEINPNNDLFNNKDFTNDYKKQYLNLELKARLSLISNLFNKHIDKTYPQKLKIFSKILGEKLPYETGMFTYGFYLYPISQFVEENSDHNLKASLNFIEKLTTRFTGEWAIRPLANSFEDEVIKQMKTWSKNKNFHIRRLSSEGLRPKLPWGKKIEWVNENPSKLLPILEDLKDDPILYVRRSVANTMGDIIKLDKDLALKTFNKWLKSKKTAENLKVISHAIRHPIKNKNMDFIELKEKINFYLEKQTT